MASSHHFLHATRDKLRSIVSFFPSLADPGLGDFGRRKTRFHLLGRSVHPIDAFETSPSVVCQSQSPSWHITQTVIHNMSYLHHFVFLISFSTVISSAVNKNTCWLSRCLLFGHWISHTLTDFTQSDNCIRNIEVISPPANEYVWSASQRDKIITWGLLKTRSNKLFIQKKGNKNFFST